MDRAFYINNWPRFFYAFTTPADRFSLTKDQESTIQVEKTLRESQEYCQLAHIFKNPNRERVLLYSMSCFQERIA
ncbi:hypothetical protein E4T56_gene13402 [Termitomyces sp. T112]|nr:hypothetical protein E4T56_gene13402 [Termitomyces sp. T112]